tara:strand:+ start:865 stop:1728 length:864 start_codon:yes stop_codon:yes gene_type:complete
MIVWLASYPKSGNTWLRFFIVSLLLGNKENINFNDLGNVISQYPRKVHFEDLISDFLNLEEVAKNWQNSQVKLNSDNKIRFFKTHNMLVRFKNNFFTDPSNTLGAIYVARDPRNIITSLKNHFSFKNYNETKNFLFNDKQIITLSDYEKKEYTKKKDYQLPQIIGSWKMHYNSWNSMKKNFLLIKYESLIKNPNKEFSKVVAFLEQILNTKFKDKQVSKAIKNSSFIKLKKMEETYGFNESAEDRRGSKKKFFNLGPKNDWKKILDKKVSDEINLKFETEMKELKYL